MAKATVKRSSSSIGQGSCSGLGDNLLQILGSSVVVFLEPVNMLERHTQAS